MTKLQFALCTVGFLTAAAMLMGTSTFSHAAGMGGSEVSTTVKSAPAMSAKDDHVKKAAINEIKKLRNSLDKEAIDARADVFQALLFLEKKDSKHAFKYLEEADGKLNVVLARDPNLKMAAIDVRNNINDLESSPEAINKIVKESKLALDNGEIQTARDMLAPMTSEMRIYTDFLPLEIYPAAIKQASKEIQNSKPTEAEATLSSVLSSIVTDEKVIPLPPIKAEGDVLEAEQLINLDKVKNKGKVLSLLISADSHLANANALGYGKYQDVRDEIASVRSKVETNMYKPNLFERAKNLFHGTEPGNKG